MHLWTRIDSHNVYNFAASPEAASSLAEGIGRLEGFGKLVLDCQALPRHIKTSSRQFRPFESLVQYNRVTISLSLQLQGYFEIRDKQADACGLTFSPSGLERFSSYLFNLTRRVDDDVFWAHPVVGNAKSAGDTQGIWFWSF